MISNLRNKLTGEPARAVQVTDSLDSLRALHKVTKAFEVLVESDCVQIRGGQGELTKVPFGDWVVRDNCTNKILKSGEIDTEYSLLP